MLDRNKQRVKPADMPPKPAYWWRLKPIELVVIDLGDWLWWFTLVNVLWVLCSLTLVLLPPATAALYDVAWQAYHGQQPTVRSFFVAMRKWAVRAWLWGLINVLLVLLIVSAVAFYRAQANDFLMAAAALIGVLIAAAQFYFWPYLMTQEQPHLVRAVRNSVFTVLGDPFWLLLHGGLSVILLVPGLVLIAPVLLILPVILTMLSTYSLLVWLHRQGLLTGNEREL